MFAIIGSDDEIDSPVYTYDVTDIRRIAFFYIKRDRDVKKIFPMLVYKFRGAKMINVVVEVFLHAGRKIGQLDATVQRIYREPFICERVIPVPYKIILRLFESRPNPFLLIFENSLISGDNSLKYGLCHLGF